MVKNLLIITALFCCLGLKSQSFSPSFKNFSQREGLNQPSPYSLCQGKDGYLWIGGENGLWRFDGTDFHHYRHQKDNPRSVAYDFVWSLFEDKAGHIWVGTYGGGLSQYHPAFDHFTNYTYNPLDSTSISDNQVRGMAEDPEGFIWVGTNKGLNRLNPKTGRFKRYGKKDGLLSDVVRQIILSKDSSQLFICTGSGLNILDLESQEFSQVKHNPMNNEGLSHTYVYELMEHPQGKLWIGTGKGLDRLDLESMKIDHFLSKEKDSATISHDVTFSIKVDPQDSNYMWFGTMHGLNRMDLRSGKFERIYADPQQPGKLSGNNIYDVETTPDGSIWVAVNNGGLFQYHPNYQKFKNHRLFPPGTDKYYSKITSVIQHDQENYLLTSYSGLIEINIKSGEKKHYALKGSDAVSMNRFGSITRLDKNRYWITSWGHFLYEWNHATKSLKPVIYRGNEEAPLFNWPILADSRGRVWIGNSERGLFLWDPEDTSFRPVPIGKLMTFGDIHDEYIAHVFEDSQGRIWVGSFGGLNLLNEEDFTFTKYSHDDKDPFSIPNNKVNHISEDDQGYLWLSTEFGLAKFNPKREEFERFYMKDGLPSNSIYSSQQDEHGHLWVATSEGLAQRGKNGQFKVYGEEDGLSDELLVKRAVYKNPNGILFFGSHSGLDYFNPSQIPTNPEPPLVRVTALEVFNQTVQPGDDSGLLEKSIEHTEHLTLGHQHSVVTFRFNAFNMINSYKNKYRYMLEGYDKEWRPITTEKMTTYTNLPPGKYTFKVIASNDEGVWNREGTRLSITVLPPWYKTWWFQSLVIFLLASMIGLTFYQRFQKIKVQKKRLEQMVRERTREINTQKEEIESQNEMLHSRNQRIEMLMKELNHRVKNNLQLVSSILNLQSRSLKDHNAREALRDGRMRMQALSLLHQKLYMDENYSEVNCKHYIEELFENLAMAFKTRYKKFDYHLEVDNFSLSLDKSIPMGLIVNELITNSFKHIQKDRLEISLIITDRKGKINISLKDNGPGFDKKALLESDSFGLSMVQSLIEQLDGTIELIPHQGTHFLIEFRYEKQESLETSPNY